MTTAFDVVIRETEVLEQIPGAWQPGQFAEMLQDMDYGDTSGMSDDEMREMCVLSLQELAPNEAAEIVLRARFTGRLRGGQITDCSHEMGDEKLWEHYSEMALHEDFFHVGSLLYAALPDDFPTPDAARVVAEVRSRDADGRRVLETPVREPFVVRLLADGMSDNAVLHRLFGDQIAAGPFDDAESIIWSFQQKPVDETTLRLDIISSGCWLDPLHSVDAYVSEMPHRDLKASVAG